MTQPWAMISSPHWISVRACAEEQPESETGNETASAVTHQHPGDDHDRTHDHEVQDHPRQQTSVGKQAERDAAVVNVGQGKARHD